MRYGTVSDVILMYVYVGRHSFPMLYHTLGNDSGRLTFLKKKKAHSLDLLVLRVTHAMVAFCKKW